MFVPFRKFSAAALVVAILSGCASAPATNGIYRFGTVKRDVRLEAAFRKPYYATLCLRVEGAAEIPGRHLHIRLPMPDGVMYISGKRNGIPSLQLSEQDVSEGPCIRDGEPMNIAEVPLDGDPVIPETQRESIYVSYPQGQLATLGYVSNTPVFDNHYRFEVDLDTLFSERKDRVREGAEQVMRGTVEVGKAVVFGVLLLAIVLCEWDSSCREKWDPGLSGAEF